MKVIAYYLPQFYENENNNKWWGKGFTEWTNTRKAKPLFKGHYQPREPYEQNYYDLSNIATMKRQADIAKEYGVYGFSIYHYWFKDGERMLDIPEKNLLEYPEIDLPFCFCWANEAWSRRWDGSEKEILMEQDYGTEEYWINHFNYLLPFFKDKRYICDDGHPMFIIYRPELIPCMRDMMKCWNELALKNGLNEICFVFQHAPYWYGEYENTGFTYGIESQPSLAMYPAVGLKNKFKLIFDDPYRILFAIRSVFSKRPFRLCNYDHIWKMILKREPLSELSIPCAFVDWDNTPRVGKHGIAFKGATPEKFKKYFGELVKKNKEKYKKDYIFINAWNEWGEGAYLEPDEKYGYAYLEAVRDVLHEYDK